MTGGILTWGLYRPPSAAVIVVADDENAKTWFPANTSELLNLSDGAPAMLITVDAAESGSDRRERLR